MEYLGDVKFVLGVSLVVQIVKNLPTMQEMWVWSLGGEDLLEMEVATHSRMLASRIPWIEEAGGLQSMGLQEIKHEVCFKASFLIRNFQ